MLAAAGQASRPPQVARPAGLTEREVDVLRLIARGQANKQVAATLGISAKTVGPPHRAHLRQGRGHHPRRGDAVRHGARPPVALTRRGDGANARCARRRRRSTLLAGTSDEEAAMPTIDINDTTLYYERTGHGPAMLFVHGMCGDADVWADQAGGSRTATPACATTGAATPAAPAATPHQRRPARRRRRRPHRGAGPRPVPAGGVERRRRHRRRRGPAPRRICCGARCSANRRCSASTPRPARRSWAS